MNSLKKVMRPGKTAKEKASGVHENRFENRARRVAWMHDPKDNKFPTTACNGKRNRHRYMKAGGILVS